MSRKDDIPIYAADGTSEGFRSLETARLLLANGYVKAAYGRKGHLKAIWVQQQDGGNPIETQARAGTKYSFPERLDNGLRCWKFKKLDIKDEDGVRFSTQSFFRRVVDECLVR